ncbi:1-(5-phosphoribosyl)-5-[(5-phosphoribosylamino)methylideneamino] imidazole-4-carboxamide isomerase [Woodsholea maritima]|uniref:1-(5-phosphoribosyl)-5-[(5- phosphoribosylamino)methylideneamino] imidazole-4-carboxamide isomerase n=1 Tax=Woodsholea maritima TaxID=240237 RepID=UPI00037A0E4E|nr:1-(5-phosphoribosyl)-5-[(5-phosphoribosylamino)methylideneamino] imidazole-4-carboxamide isomerase [Woodsholea maritima]
MILYPAIDVLDGRVVRLKQGDFNAVTDYGDDPVRVAEGYLAAGASWLHMVDLSGARDGARRQHDLVKAVSDVGIKVQTGGGVRSEADVEAILEAGASRAVIGSLAVTDVQTVIGWLARFGGDQLALAFDVRIMDGAPYPTTHGWAEADDRPLGELLSDYRRAGLRHALVTDVGRDGLLEGPNLDLYRDLVVARPDVAWQASGGVASLNDLRALKSLGASGAIIGKALFEGRFTVGDALAEVA